MPPPSQEEINALIAKKRAEVMARIANLNIPSGAAGSLRPPAPRPAAAVPARPAAAVLTKSAPPTRSAAPTPASIQSTIAAARARIEAQLKNQGIGARPAASQSYPTELHPVLQGEFKPASKKARFSRMPASAKSRQQKSESPQQLKVDHAIPESFADPAQNPYFDPALGQRTHGPQTRRRDKQFHFIKPGRFVEQAEKQRAEAKMEQLKVEIAERAAAARLEEGKEFDVSTIQPSEPPEVEWWDAPFLIEASYASAKRLEGPESLCTIYVQHPVPIEPPQAIRSQGQAPAQLILTRKERKKIRRQRRLEQQRERREKVMLGLLPPEPPKLRMSNFMRIMANESVPDPTKLEAEVRRQMEERKSKHEADNLARKLTKEQRHEKNAAKVASDEARGLVSAAFRISKLEHAQHWFKLSVNAEQMHLTGTAVSCPEQALVVVEGSAKNIKAYKKLMLRRIDWTMDQEEEYADNECHLIWQGEVEAHKFKKFWKRTCPDEAQAKSWLAKVQCDSLWQLAKQYDAGDSITLLDPFA